MKGRGRINQYAHSLGLLNYSHERASSCDLTSDTTAGIRVGHVVYVYIKDLLRIGRVSGTILLSLLCVKFVFFNQYSLTKMHDGFLSVSNYTV